MAKISLPDFFRYFAGTAEQLEAVVLLESMMDSKLLQDDSAWVIKYREKPEPPPAATGEQLVTLEQLAAIWECAPHLISSHEIEEMNHCLRTFEINTRDRIKHFLSQTAHESGGGKWKKELADGTAYNNRSDLGNGPDDGPRYKGAGYLQMTGRYNYQRFSDWIKDPRVMEGVDYVAETWPFTCSGFWWMDNRMNDLCDQGADCLSVTKRVNGGTNGLADRQHYLEICERVL